MARPPADRSATRWSTRSSHPPGRCRRTRAEAAGAHHEEKPVWLTALPAEAGEPLTIWEAAFRMTWNRTWAEPPATLRGMAAGEAAAHLRTLDVRGAIRRIPGVDPVRFAVHSETSDV